MPTADIIYIVPNWFPCYSSGHSAVVVGVRIVEVREPAVIPLSSPFSGKEQRDKPVIGSNILSRERKKVANGRYEGTQDYGSLYINLSSTPIGRACARSRNVRLSFPAAASY